MYRYAVYSAPQANSVWWELGSQWLGRCVQRNEAVAQPQISGLEQQRFFNLTKAPRQYGWHATLRAPFRLSPPHTQTDVLHTMEQIAKAFSSSTIPAWTIQRMGNFLALVPKEPLRMIQVLANRCVTDLHPLAAPLSPEEILKRQQKNKLNPLEIQLLQEWGYPYVFDRYTYHWTLTDDISTCTEEEVQSLIDAAYSHFHAVPTMPIDGISLFGQPEPNSDFQLIHQTLFVS